MLMACGKGIGGSGMNGGKIAPCNLFAAHIFNHKNVFIWVKKKEHMNAFKKRM